MSDFVVPDATRGRVHGYCRLLHLTYMNTILSRVFSRSTESYVETPVTIRTAVLGLRDEVISDNGNFLKIK